jgi:hypothetical protein
MKLRILNITGTHQIFCFLPVIKYRRGKWHSHKLYLVELDGCQIVSETQTHIFAVLYPFQYTYNEDGWKIHPYKLKYLSSSLLILQTEIKVLNENWSFLCSDSFICKHFCPKYQDPKRYFGQIGVEDWHKNKILANFRNFWHFSKKFLRHFNLFFSF